MSAHRVALRYRSRRRRTGTRPHTALKSLAAFLVLATVGVVGAGVATAGAGLFFATSQYQAVAETVVPAEEIVSTYSRGGAKVYDRHGVLLYEFVDEVVGLRRPVSLDEISPLLIEATIAVEDPDFWDNPGINVRGTLRAGIENFAPFLVGRTAFLEGTGGSSITQQLARNVYMSPEERQDRSIPRKLKEMVIARELTERYSKEQILEWYLNLLPYGGIYVGIEAAAQGYFGKPASDLTLAEAALLAGIPQSPGLYNPLGQGNIDPTTGELVSYGLTKARQNDVLTLMVRAGVITPSEADEAREEPMDFREARFDIEAPHFVLGRIADEIAARFGPRAVYEGGLEVVTTLDLELQKMALEIVDRNVRDFGEQANLYNGAYVALDPHTGQILVYVGSRDYFNLEIEGNNDNIVARNSPGSTLKPFTYLTAFTQGWGTGTAILDTPITIEEPDGSEFKPRNPGTGFRGPVPAAEALGNSFNIPAIKTMMANGVQETIGMYRRFGYTTLDNPLGYGPALTTGGGEITLMDQAIAYSVLAAGGVMRGQEAVVTPAQPGGRTIEPVALLRVTDPDGDVLYEFDQPAEQRIVDEAYTYLVTSILNDPANTCVTYGACGALALSNGYPSAAKTGTSEPFETIGLIGETWTMGYTPHLVSGIWAGNADNEPIQGISSTSVSLRAWKEFTEAASEYLGLPPDDFDRPPGVVEREVCWPSGRLPTAACPRSNRYASLYAAEVLPETPSEAPGMYDNWWRAVEVDARTGLIANSGTPSFARNAQVRLVLPPDEIAGWGGLGAWAAAHGVRISGGTSGPSGPLVAEIRTPQAQQSISGTLTVTGRAASEHFTHYTLEWGQGLDPSSWTPIASRGEPVSGGVLGTWNTSSLSPGNYTLRLMLRDDQLGTRMFAIPVRVGAGGGQGEDAEDGTQLSTQAAITSPAAGSVVSGTVGVTGTAVGGAVLGYQVQVRAADSGQWQTIGSGTEPREEDTLATWDTSTGVDGTWVIRLIVSGSGGPQTYETMVTVQNHGDG